jgi:hypothetical protein
MSGIELPVLQHQSHPDVSSPDPLDGLVHPSERHDIDNGPDAMPRRTGGPASSTRSNVSGLKVTVEGVA